MTFLLGVPHQQRRQLLLPHGRLGSSGISAELEGRRRRSTGFNRAVPQEADLRRRQSPGAAEDTHEGGRHRGGQPPGRRRNGRRRRSHQRGTSAAAPWRGCVILLRLLRLLEQGAGHLHQALHPLPAPLRLPLLPHEQCRIEGSAVRRQECVYGRGGRARAVGEYLVHVPAQPGQQAEGFVAPTSSRGHTRSSCPARAAGTRAGEILRRIRRGTV